MKQQKTTELAPYYWCELLGINLSGRESFIDVLLYVVSLSFYSSSKNDASDN